MVRKTERNPILTFILVVAISLIIGKLGSNTAYAGVYKFFGDNEYLLDSAVKTGTLDMGLTSNTTNFVPSIDLMPGESSVRNIFITNYGTLPFKYYQEYNYVSGNSAFCGELELTVTYKWYDDGGVLHEDEKYDGSLSAFNLNLLSDDVDLVNPNSHSYYLNLEYGENDHWFEYEVEVPADLDDLYINEVCNFDIKAGAAQPEMAYGSAFHDDELLSGNSIDTDIWTVPATSIDAAVAHVVNGYACGVGSALDDDGLSVTVQNYDSTYTLQGRYFVAGGSYGGWFDLTDGLWGTGEFELTGITATFNVMNTGNSSEGPAGWQVRVLNAGGLEVGNVAELTYTITNDLDSLACEGTMTMGYETAETVDDTADGDPELGFCPVTTADRSQNGGASSLQVLKWTKVDNATSYRVTGYRLDGDNWVGYGGSYTLGLGDVTTSGNVVAYTSWATAQYTTAYYIEALDTGGNVIGVTQPESDDFICTFSVDLTSPGDVLINELMWMGSTSSGSDEWIELRNTTGSDIDLSGWKLTNAGPDGDDLEFPDGSTLSANGYFLIANFDEGNSSMSVDPDWVTEDLALDNDGEEIELRNGSDALVDKTPNNDWAAGSDNDPEKQSMERNSVPGSGSSAGNWHTCISTASGHDCRSTDFWDSEGDNYGTPKHANYSENDESLEEETSEEENAETEDFMPAPTEPIQEPVVEEPVTDEPTPEEPIIEEDVEDETPEENEPVIEEPVEETPQSSQPEGDQ